MWRYLKRILIGKPLKTLDEGQSHLTKFKALALLSSDALSSVAYGTEQITTVLVTLSAAAIWYSLPIAAIVLIPAPPPPQPGRPARWGGRRGAHHERGHHRGVNCRGLAVG